MRWGVQSGDVEANSAVVWSRASAASGFRVEWSTSPDFRNARLVDGMPATSTTDYCGKARLIGLPSATKIHYRAAFGGADWTLGSFSTPPTDARPVLLAWSGDVNGQGWGIGVNGGMPAFSATRDRKPELFLHCGDAIYADVPIPPFIKSERVDWQNWRDPDAGEAARAAETLADFRRVWRYARNSPEVRALSAETPILSIWDDHEVTDNWNPLLVPDAMVVAARRAMYEHAPTFRDPSLPMYRVMPWGPLVDVFLLDDRTWRSPNDPAPSSSAGMLGAEQSRWLVDSLRASRAKWKLVVNGQPLARASVGRGRNAPLVWDAYGNLPGPPVEREVELAGILSGVRGVTNIVWLSADVHYAGATRFDPARAAFSDFDPFWELGAGPMHASCFAADPLDPTFGAEAEWCSAGPVATGNPQNGEQYVGFLAISADAITATWVDAFGGERHRLLIKGG